jgi:hypothetical protein
MCICCTVLAGTNSWTGQTKGLTIDSQQTVVNSMLWCEDDELCRDMTGEDLQLARDLLAEERALLKVVQQAQQWRADGGQLTCSDSFSYAYVVALRLSLGCQQHPLYRCLWVSSTVQSLVTLCIVAVTMQSDLCAAVVLPAVAVGHVHG